MEDTLTHFEYLADQIKLACYRSAIDKLVRPDHVVLDLGCGTGVLGLMALQAGAVRAHFVDDGSVIEVARRTVIDAGFGDRAKFYQKSSFELDLPERVDVVICDHVGYFGIDYGILEFLADARERFLKQDGQIVPAELKLRLAPVESQNCRRIVGKWSDGSIPAEYGWIGGSAANAKHGVTLQAQDVLAGAETLGTLTLGEDAPAYLSWETRFEAERDGDLDGVAGWFDCRLFDNVHMTNSPLADEALSRPQAFLPLPSPVPVYAGDPILVTLMTRPLDNVIGWVVELPRSDQRFVQTTFNGLQLDSHALLRASPDRMANLNERGRARLIVLSYCDGTRTVAEVQALVERDHPDLFPSRHATRSFVRSVLEWDTSN